MRTTTAKRRPAQAVLAAAMTIGVVAVGTPAVAASKTCTIAALWGRSCTTGTIPPNSSSHMVSVTINTVYCGARWQVIDAGNSVQVGAGEVPANQENYAFIYGLYSPAGYYLRVYNSCWPTYGRISN